MVINRSREAWKTYGNVFDQFTERNLRKLSSQGYFEELVGAVALGKEANIFTAKRRGGDTVIVKIYRLENCNFNKMYSYIAQDPRYVTLKGQKRKIIFAWTQREYRNLLKAREVVRVPTPLVFKDNILVMEYIDDQGRPAYQLKDVTLEDPEEVFEQVIEGVQALFDTGLVHGDLSEFNILIQGGNIVFIDLSQTTSLQAANAKDLLKRDLSVICAFFKRRGYEADPETTYTRITSKD